MRCQSCGESFARCGCRPCGGGDDVYGSETLRWVRTAAGDVREDISRGMDRDQALARRCTGMGQDLITMVETVI
jgi:hypothetical protein